MNSKMLLIGLAALPLTAGAAGFDYTYVEAGYVTAERDVGPIDVDGDGLALRGSMAINDKFHGFAEYATQDLDFGVDANTFSIGAGANWSLQQDLDFVGELAWVNAEIETGFGDADDDGLGLGAGLRARANDKIELEGMLHYVDLEDSDTSLSLGGRYYFSSVLALLGGLHLNDDDTWWNIGVRAEFGGR
jgi:hypothetical protein